MKVPTDTAEFVPTDTAEFVPTDTAEFVPTDTAEFVPTDTAEFVPTDTAEFVQTDTAEFVPTDTAEFVPTDTAEFVPTDTAEFVLYLDLQIAGQLRTKLYDKRDDVNLPTVKFPFIYSNIPAALAYVVYISVDMIFQSLSSIQHHGFLHP